MASVPSKLELQVAAIATYLAANLSDVVVKRSANQLLPQWRVRPEDWPDGTNRLIVVHRGARTSRPNLVPDVKGTQTRLQFGLVPIRAVIKDDDEDTRATTIDALERQLLNAVEALNESQDFGALQYDVDWVETRPTLIAQQADTAPYAGTDITLRVKLHE